MSPSDIQKVFDVMGLSGAGSSVPAVGVQQSRGPLMDFPISGSTSPRKPA
ncbi:hypothetical protein [Miltoncostaea oceani]|nr:hypothetical protein [Miltoncostaea oceani]